MTRRHFTIVLDAFDGYQYGMLPIAVFAYSVEEARRLALAEAEKDGWQKVKVMFEL